MIITFHLIGCAFYLFDSSTIHARVFCLPLGIAIINITMASSSVLYLACFFNSKKASTTLLYIVAFFTLYMHGTTYRWFSLCELSKGFTHRATHMKYQEQKYSVHYTLHMTTQTKPLDQGSTSKIDKQSLKPYPTPVDASSEQETMLKASKSQ